MKLKPTAMTNFEIAFLDHVAITVKDLDASAKWYQKVLGLKKYQLPKWGTHPIFLLAGKAGVALFPANSSESLNDFNGLKIDHFAFNVTNDNFVKARKRYEELNIEYTFKDHHYFQSIYIKDLDNHTVELTTLMVDEGSFYK